MACLRLFLAWALLAVVAGQSLRTRRLWSEPRVQLVNEKTKLYLTVAEEGNDWKAEGASECSSGRCNWFKLSGREWGAVGDQEIPEVIAIKTDWFPQSALDEKLEFFGGILDNGKSWEPPRKWEVVRLKFDVAQQDGGVGVYKSSTFAFAHYESRLHATPKFLAMKNDGKVFFKSISRSQVHDDLEVQWKASQVGAAPTPAEAFMVGLGIPATVLSGALTGGLGAYWVAAQVVGVGLTIEATSTAIALGAASGVKILVEQILPFLKTERVALFAS